MKKIFFLSLACFLCSQVFAIQCDPMQNLTHIKKYRISKTEDMHQIIQSKISKRHNLPQDKKEFLSECIVGQLIYLYQQKLQTNHLFLQKDFIDQKIYNLNQKHMKKIYTDYELFSVADQVEDAIQRDLKQFLGSKKIQKLLEEYWVRVPAQPLV